MLGRFLGVWAAADLRLLGFLGKEGCGLHAHTESEVKKGRAPKNGAHGGVGREAGTLDLGAEGQAEGSFSAFLFPGAIKWELPGKEVQSSPHGQAFDRVGPGRPWMLLTENRKDHSRAWCKGTQEH